MFSVDVKLSVCLVPVWSLSAVLGLTVVMVSAFCWNVVSTDETAALKTNRHTETQTHRQTERNRDDWLRNITVKIQIKCISEPNLVLGTER